MRSIISFIVLGSLAAISFAETAFQTDWSLGPGEPGPVGSLQSRFNLCSSIDWFGQEGQLTLGADRSDSPIVIAEFDSDIGPLWVADMDGDGDQDVLGCDNEEMTVKCWENLDGIGETWGIHTLADLSGVNTITSICADDFNGDDQMDIAVSYFYGASVFLCDVWPSQWYGVPLVNGLCVYQIRSCDLDADGDPDIIARVEISWYGSLNVYENLGLGMDWECHSGDFIISDFELADIDGDGDDDAAAARYWGGGVAWCKNTAGIGLGFTMIKEGTGAYSVTTGDFDRDGDIDVVADYGAFLEWYINDLQASEEWEVRRIESSVSLYWPDLAAGDFDLDGDIDIARRATGHFIMHWNSGDGAEWVEEAVFDAELHGGEICSRDMDQDGITDIVASWEDSDQLRWYRLASHAGVGELESSILFLPSDPDWDLIQWTGEEPVGTDIAFQVRSSDDPTDLGEWSDTITVSGSSLLGILDDFDNYCQYRVYLSSENPPLSPILSDFSLVYNPLDIQGATGGSCPLLHPVLPNPAAGGVELGYYIPGSAEVSLIVFDLSGRAVQIIEMGELSEGEYRYIFTGEPPGVYHVMMSSGDYSVTRSFVII